MKKNLNKKGFTLLELLIVIGIIAALSVALVLAINPSEVLKKGRDSQRISDLTTMKKAIGLYLTTTSLPKLAGVDNEGCKGTSLLNTWQPSTDHIYYSLPTESGTISATILDGTTFTTGGGPVQVVRASVGKTDGTGWIPINFSTLAGGSPISNLPVDPTNKMVDITSPTNTDLVYRYICMQKDLTYEIHATLESTAYTTTDNKMARDGGTSDNYYEVGTSLAMLSTEGAGGGGQASADLTSVSLQGGGPPSNYNFLSGIYSYPGVGMATSQTYMTVSPLGVGVITVNGNIVISGQPSPNISISTGVPVTITIVATEAGKSPKTYTIIVTKGGQPAP